MTCSPNANKCANRLKANFTLYLNCAIEKSVHM